MSKKIELTEEEENNILLFYSEVKNKSATVRHFGISIYTLNKIIKEKGDFFKNKTKIEIVNFSRELSTDKDLLFYYVAISRPFMAIALLVPTAVALASYARLATIRLVISVIIFTFG